MSRLFVTVLNMSFTASIVILAVLALRLLLKRVPRVFSYALWLVVLLRLLSPFSLSVSWGIVPSEKLVEIGAGTNLWLWENSASQIEGMQEIYDIYNHFNPDGTYGDTVLANGKEYSLSKISNMLLQVGRIWMGMGRIWIVGVILLVLHGTVSYRVLANRLRKCEQKELDADLNGMRSDNFTIVISDEIKTPFVSGLIKPVIYLPKELDKEQLRLVLEHEKMHIMRRDYLIKVIAYLAVCIHWFNPLAWIAFHFMEQDMEVSCDEAVLKKVGYDKGKEYAKTLLALSGQHSWKAGSPIAFGENSVKIRIKKAVRLRETKACLIIVAFVGVLAAAVLLLVNGNWNEQPASIAEATATEVDEESIIYLPNEKITQKSIAWASESEEAENEYYSASDTDGEREAGTSDATEAEYTYEGANLDDYTKNKVTELAQQYEQFGLSAEIYENDYQLYYNGEPVCFFADNKYGWNTDTFKGTLFSRPANEKNGFTGVCTEYDADGNVVGLVLLSEEELR